MKHSEQIIALKRADLGLADGFTPAADKPLVAHTLYVGERYGFESNNPQAPGRAHYQRDTFVQPIPYAVVLYNNHALAYRRASPGDTRLEGTLSIGWGGHMEDKDCSSGFVDGDTLTTPCTIVDHLDSLAETALLRELREELGISDHHVVSAVFSGWWYSQESEVSRDHVGLVYVVSLQTDVELKPESGVELIGWVPLSNVANNPGYEPWSRQLAAQLQDTCSEFNMGV